MGAVDLCRKRALKPNKQTKLGRKRPLRNTRFVGVRGLSSRASVIIGDLLGLHSLLLMSGRFTSPGITGLDDART